MEKAFHIVGVIQPTIHMKITAAEINALRNVHPEADAEEAHRAELRAALEATLGCTLAEAAAKIEAALRTPNRNV